MKFCLFLIAMIMAAFSPTLASAVSDADESGSLDISSKSVSSSSLDPSTNLRKKKHKKKKKKSSNKDDILFEGFIMIDNEDLNPKEGGHQETVNKAISASFYEFYKDIQFEFKIQPDMFSKPHHEDGGWLGDTNRDGEQALGWGHRSYGTSHDGLYRFFANLHGCGPFCINDDLYRWNGGWDTLEGTENDFSRQVSSKSMLTHLTTHPTATANLGKQLCKELKKSGDPAFAHAKNCQFLVIASPGNYHHHSAME